MWEKVLYKGCCAWCGFEEKFAHDSACPYLYNFDKLEHKILNNEKYVNVPDNGIPASQSYF